MIRRKAGHMDTDVDWWIAEVVGDLKIIFYLLVFLSKLANKVMNRVRECRRSYWSLRGKSIIEEILRSVGKYVWRVE